MKQRYLSRFSFFAIAFLLFATISCGGKPKESREVPENIKKLAAVGIATAPDGGIVGGSLAQAWCKELDNTPHIFDVYEISLKFQEDRPGFNSLVKTLVKQYVGDSPVEEDQFNKHMYSQKFGQITKILEYDKKYGGISIYTNYSQPRPKSSVTIPKETLLVKAKEFVEKYIFPGNSQPPYFVSDFDVEEGESEGDAPMSYDLSLNFLEGSLPFSDTSIHRNNLTKANFRFDAKGEFVLAEFVPGTILKSSSVGSIKAMSSNQALEKARKKVKIESKAEDLANYKMTCHFDLVTSVRKYGNDKKIYFLPSYLFKFDEIRVLNSKEVRILAIKDPAIALQFQIESDK